MTKTLWFPVWLLLPWSLMGQTPLQAVAPDLPPIVISRPGTGPTGLSVEIVEALVRKAGMAVDFDIEPFARGLDRATKEPGVLLFPVVRTAEREKTLLFLGPVNRVSYGLFRKRSQGPPLKAVSDLNHATVGVLNRDAAALYLTAQGVEVTSVGSLEQMAQMLWAGRLDFVATSEVSLDWQLRALGLPSSAVEEALPLPGVNLDPYSYVVVSKATAPDLVQRLVAAAAALQQSGEWERIYRAWTVHP